MESSQALERYAPDSSQQWLPALSLDQAKARYTAMRAFVASQLKEGLDFGQIPGTNKKTLYKPAAEKLAMFFGYEVDFEWTETIKDWSGAGPGGGEPLFYFECVCKLSKGGHLMHRSYASANSRESRYRYRWVAEADVPVHLNKSGLKTKGGGLVEFVFSYEKRETTGRYGKPESYWQQFDEALKNHTAKTIQRETRNGDKTYPAYVIDSTLYRVPNEEVPDLINTLQKMAQKRALVGTVLIAVNGSDYFTQDLEDNLDGDHADNVIDTTATVAPVNGQASEPKPAPAQASKPKATAKQAEPAEPTDSGEPTPGQVKALRAALGKEAKRIGKHPELAELATELLAKDAAEHGWEYDKEKTGIDGIPPNRLKDILALFGRLQPNTDHKDAKKSAKQDAPADGELTDAQIAQWRLDIKAQLDVMTGPNAKVKAFKDGRDAMAWINAEIAFQTGVETHDIMRITGIPAPCLAPTLAKLKEHADTLAMLGPDEKK
jgi:hypothetical protein